VEQREHCKGRGLHFFYGKGNENHQLEAGFLVHQRTLSAVERVDFVSNRMSYIEC